MIIKKDGFRDEDITIDDVLYSSKRIGRGSMLILIFAGILAIHITIKLKSLNFDGISVMRVPNAYVLSYLLEPNMFDELNTYALSSEYTESYAHTSSENIEAYHNNNEHCLKNTAEYYLPFLWFNVRIFVKRKSTYTTSNLDDITKTIDANSIVGVHTFNELFIPLEFMKLIIKKPYLIPIGSIESYWIISSIDESIIDEPQPFHSNVADKSLDILSESFSDVETDNESVFTHVSENILDECNRIETLMKKNAHTINLSEWDIEIAHTYNNTVIKQNCIMKLPAIMTNFLGMPFKRSYYHFFGNTKVELERIYGSENRIKFVESCIPYIEKEQQYRRDRIQGSIYWWIKNNFLPGFNKQEKK